MSQQQMQVFCYVNSVFAPGLDEGLGGLWKVRELRLFPFYHPTPASCTFVFLARRKDFEINHLEHAMAGYSAEQKARTLVVKDTLFSPVSFLYFLFSLRDGGKVFCQPKEDSDRVFCGHISASKRTIR